MMKYIKAVWIHDFEDEPNLFYHEVDKDGFEIRKILIYKDDHFALASTSIEKGDAFLSSKTIPSVHEINEDAQFLAKEITCEEFEQIWAEYLYSNK